MRWAVIALILFSSLALADATKEEAYLSIQSANATINQMETDGFGVNYPRDLLHSAMLAYERANSSDLFTYDDVIAITLRIDETKTKAYNLRDIIRSVEIDIENYKEEGIDTAEPERLIDLSKDAFNNERYNEAESLLQESKDSLETILQKSSLIDVISRSSRSFLAKNWPDITVMVIILSFASIFAWKRIRVKKLREMIESMKAEKITVKSLLKDSQKKRFKENTLSESVYSIKTEKYQQRLNDIEYQLPAAEKELRKLNGRELIYGIKGRKNKDRRAKRKHIRK